jgi:hypothetical protein
VQFAFDLWQRSFKALLVLFGLNLLHIIGRNGAFPKRSTVLFASAGKSFSMFFPIGLF